MGSVENIKFAMKDGTKAVSVQPSKEDVTIALLQELLSEVKSANAQLRAVESNTKDSVKDMRWYMKRDDHINIYVRISVVSVGDIDAVKQEFQCEFYLTVKWKEPRFSGKTEDEIDWDSAWAPGLYFMDVVQYDIFERHLMLVNTENDIPDVVQYFHIKGTVKEVLEVNEFPFDYQDLTLILTSNWDTSQVTILKDPNKDDNIRTWNFTARQEWDLQPHVLTESTQNEPEEGASQLSYPLYKMRLHVMRQYSFYIYNVALIMCLITILTFSSFAVKVDSVGDRIQITLTLLLTSVAFKYYVQQFVPTVSYLTLLDKYVLICMIFQFLMAAVHNSVSGLITNKKALDYFEWICLGLALFAFVLINIIFAIFSMKYYAKNKKQMVADKITYKETNRACELAKEEAKKKESWRNQDMIRNEGFV